MKIMHFGDVHFGVETYGRTDPDTGLSTRLQDFKKSLNYAIDKALEADIDLALFAGDAYKSRDPSQTHQREFAACVRRLTDAKVPLVMVTGNHDLPSTKGRASAIEIYDTLGVSGVHILAKPEVRCMETKSGPIQVAGMPYLLRSMVLSREECKNKTIQEITDLIVQKYHDYIGYLARNLNPDIPSVLLGHFWIKNAKVSAQTGYLSVAEPEVLVSTAANPAFGYVAMGHIHKFQDLNKHGAPPVVYCGSIDRVDFSERQEEKGFVLVDLAKDRAEYEFVPVPARRFVDIEVDADTENPTERIVRAIDEADVRDAIVRLLYHVSEEKAGLVRDSEIRDALSAAFLVVSVTKDIMRNSLAVRNRLLNETLNPIQALEMYLESREDFRKRKDSLMDYARPLIEELISEERGLAGWDGVE